jgi:hypothetical protein
MYATYERLNVHVVASALTVIRAARKRLTRTCRKDRTGTELINAMSSFAFKHAPAEASTKEEILGAVAIVTGRAGPDVC